MSFLSLIATSVTCVCENSPEVSQIFKTLNEYTGGALNVKLSCGAGHHLVMSHVTTHGPLGVSSSAQTSNAASDHNSLPS